MKELITKRGYTILSSLFFFIAISVISGELIFVTISMFLFSIFLVELFIFLFSSTELEKIEVVRKITKNRLFVGENLSIKTTLENNGLRTLGLLKILNKIPNELEAIKETNNYVLNLSPETKVELESEVKAIQMGKINLGILSLGLFDKFGLFIMIVVNRNYCKKILVILPGQSHPEQHHKNKEETFHVLYGEIELELDGKSRTCETGDIVTILPKVRHTFSSKIGAVIEEISTTHYKDDSYYTDPVIMKNKKRKTKLTHWME